jgi:hypothetical protein
LKWGLCLIFGDEDLMVVIFLWVFIRDSSWPAEADLRWQAAGRWTYPCWLQYPEGLVSCKDSFFLFGLVWKFESNWVFAIAQLW